MREVPEYGIAGFLYLSFEEAAEQEDRSQHHALMIFYVL